MASLTGGGADRLAAVTWVPDNPDFLTIFGAAVGALAALTAVLAGLAQFTAGAKARRLLAWTTEALEIEPDATRQAILRDVMRRTQGRLLAAHYVASWRFVEPALWTLLAPWSLFNAAHRADSLWSLITSILASATFLALPYRRGIRLYAERYRVMHQFSEGHEIGPVRTDLMEQMEGGTRREFRLGYQGATAVVALAASVAWIVTAPERLLPWVVALVSVIALWFTADNVRSYVRKIARNPPPHAVEV